MSSITFGCTALMGVNKVGVLKPDADGYYEVVLGALDFNNSVGAVYPEKSAREIFKSSSGFMRRIANGMCRGEYGHPKREPGMRFEDFLRRIMTIEETRVSHHIKEVRVDHTSVKHEGRPVIAIIGKVRPCGPFGAALKEQLENPHENVAFSIRSITNDEYVSGKLHKHLAEICTWDYVTEPGISVANKYKAPALESLQEVPASLSVLRGVVDSDTMKGIGFESSQMLRNVVDMAVKRNKATVSGNAAPSSRW